MTHQQAVAYLHHLLGNFSGAKLGLERVQALVAELDHPERAYPSVHIAGTNGKGSTAAMIESGLRADGRRTGFYSSPHLTRFNERFRLDGLPISDGAFAKAVEATRGAVERMLGGGEDERLRPTMFEVVTAAAFEAFRQAEVDWGVIEVGLGGRLDATNVIDADVAVVTPIGLDHEAWLGNTLTAIAGEKAGILKPGCRAAFAPQAPEAGRVLELRARELGIEYRFVDREWRVEDVEHDPAGRFRFRAVSHEIELMIELGLAGEHQIHNALTAIAALEAAGVGPDAITQGLNQAQWPGRLEVVSGAPSYLLDCAHNPAGARTLAHYLERFQRGRLRRLVFGASRDKAIDEVADLLFPHVEEVLLTRAAVSRSVSPATLARIVDHHHANIRVTENVAEALEIARADSAPDDLIVVAGSIFLVGEARRLLSLPDA